MAVQVMITLPDNVYQGAERLSRLIGRQVADVMAGIVVSSVSSDNISIVLPSSPVSLADSEVLALADLQMEATQDRRLSYLLDQQQARNLTQTEDDELHSLMQIYQQGLVRKAQAQREAVRRGLLKQ